MTYLADDLLERRQSLLKCTTGSSRLDSFLKGGIETQANLLRFPLNKGGVISASGFRKNGMVI